MQETIAKQGYINYCIVKTMKFIIIIFLLYITLYSENSVTKMCPRRKGAGTWSGHGQP